MKFRGRVNEWLWVIAIAAIALVVIVAVQWFQRDTDPLQDWPMINDAMAQALDQLQNEQQSTESSTDQATILPSDQDKIKATAEPSLEADGKISINRADVQQLQQLSGIGPVKAQAIVDYRLKTGGFQTIDELMNVKGIGPKTFAKIQEQITVD